MFAFSSRNNRKWIFLRVNNRLQQPWLFWCIKSYSSWHKRNRRCQRKCGKKREIIAITFRMWLWAELAIDRNRDESDCFWWTSRWNEYNGSRIFSSSLCRCWSAFACQLLFLALLSFRIHRTHYKNRFPLKIGAEMRNNLTQQNVSFFFFAFVEVAKRSVP